MNALSPSRLAARLLRLFPAEFRRRHGRQLVATYADLERAGRAPRWPVVILDLLVSALRVHVESFREPSYEPAPSLSHATRGPHMEGFARDLRLALRGLLRAPGFTLVAVVTLALGIGANAAIFSVVHGVLLRSLDLGDPDRLVAVWHHDLDDPDSRVTVSPGNFRDWREQSNAFEALAAYGYETRTLGGEGQDIDSRRVESLAVTGDFFRVAGVEPIQGGLLTPDDDAPGAASGPGGRVVLGYEAWTSIFGGDSSRVGRSIQLDGRSMQVAGVLPPGFRIAGQPVDVYVPMGWDEEFRASRTEYSYHVIGRLAAGVSLKQAQHRLDAVMSSLRSDFPTENGDLGAAILPLRSDLVRHVSTPIWLVMGAVGMVLLIGCANLAQLLLARAEARRRELAVQRALGATAWTLVRRSVAESLLLASLGCISGLVVAKATLHTLVTTLPAEVPGIESIGIDPTVLAFTVGVSLVAGLLFGIAPALRLPSADRLRQGRTTTTRSPAGRPMRVSGSLLTIAEVALAVVLLCGTGLLMRSLQASTAVEPGYATDVLRVRASLGGAGFDEAAQRVAYLQRAEERLAALPGVDDVAVAINLPPEYSYNNAWFRRADQPLADGETPPWISYRVVMPGYFEALELGLMAGRPLDAHFAEGAPLGVVLNRAAADRFFPDVPPVGQRVILGPDGSFPPAEVVGLVDDGQNLSLRGGGPMVYMTYESLPYWDDLAFGLRSSVDPAGLAKAAREALRELDPRVAVYGTATFDELHREQFALTRAVGRLLGAIAGLGLVMAVVGLFGVLSYSVSRRRREMGIRLALGARAGELRRMVVGQGLARVAAGLALGVGTALLLTRFLEGLIFGVKPTDPWTYLGVSAVLLAAASAACWWPAMRASAVAPAEVLKEE